LIKRQDKKKIETPKAAFKLVRDFRFALYIIINFKTHKINKDTHKLNRISTLIIIIKKFALSELPRKTKNQETRPRNIYTSERLSTRRINTWQTVIKLNSISNGLLAA